MLRSVHYTTLLWLQNNGINVNNTNYAKLTCDPNNLVLINISVRLSGYHNNIEQINIYVKLSNGPNKILRFNIRHSARSTQFPKHQPYRNDKDKVISTQLYMRRT